MLHWSGENLVVVQRLQFNDLTSYMSTSSLVKPTCERILGIARIGEIPIYRGSTPTREWGLSHGSKEYYPPTTVDATYFPMISIPSCSALVREVKMQMPAPSPTPLAFPAVVLAFPHCGNAGFKAPRSSSLTPFRIVSSTDTTNPFNSIGRISSAKMPFARAYNTT